MTPDERVMVVYLDDAAEAPIEEAVRSQGVEAHRAATPGEALTALVSAEEPRAVLVKAADEAEAERLSGELAARLPSGKMILCTPDGEAEPDAFVAADRRLWLRGDVTAPENARRMARFLQGNGLRWASEFRSSVLKRRLLDSAMRLDARAADERNKLWSIARDLSAFTELGETLREALRNYMEILRCEAGSLYLWEERSETLVLQAAEGPDQEQRLGLRQKLGEGLAGWVAERREPVLVTDARQVRRLRGRACERYSNASCLAVPITDGEQLLGVVCLTMPADGEAFEPDDLQTAQALGQKLGALLRPFGLLSELRYFNERLVEVFRACSDLVVEKDSQVEAMRVLSSDILNGVPLGVIAYDPDLHTCFANAAAEEAFAIRADARPLAEVELPLAGRLEVEPAEWRRKLHGVVAEDAGFRLERVPWKADGAERVFDVHGSPLHDSDGATIGGILTVRDVTEDVEMEAKLSHSERLALVGTIAAKVAHELNNPLDGILRFLNLATRQLEDEPDEARRFLEESRRGLLRMGSIVGQLLAFSRGHRATGRPPTLSQALRDALALYEERARVTDVEVKADVPPDLPVCPSPELFEVFSNVIKNSLDAMPDGGTLNVRAEPRNGEVVFTIADSGPGVPPELRDRIFEPFYTTKRDGTGTGLGLAACRDVLGRLGGGIELLPSEQGAVFQITVPAEAAVSGGAADG